MAAKKCVQELDKLFGKVESTIGGNERQLREFLEFAQGRLGDLIEVYQEKEKAKNKEQDEILAKIVAELQLKTNVNAQAPDEQFHFPSTGRFAKYNSKNTEHVDNFLYDDDAVDELVRQRKLSQHYCLDCGSKNVDVLNFISHSFALEDLQFIFSDACVGDAKNKIVLDVGSRLGSVLYYAALYTKAKQVVGVEINKYFVDLQLDILGKFPNLKKKASVVHNDIFKVEKSLIDQCDIVIMHNLFEWFTTPEQHLEAWQLVRKTFTKKGVKLVMYPSLDVSLKDAGLDEKGIEAFMATWVKNIPLEYDDEDECGAADHEHHNHHHQHDENCKHDHDDEDERICLYEIL